MRYAPTWLVLGLMGVIASVGCFFGSAPATDSPTVDLQATIDAALARVAASQETGPAPTATPPPATAAPTVRPTNAPSPQVIPATAIPRQPPTATPEPSAFSLSEARNWEFAEQADPEVVAQISGISWIADGLQTADEFNAAERMVNVGLNAPEVLSALLASDEFKNGLRPMDLPALLSLQRMAQDRPDRLAQLASAGWFLNRNQGETRIVYR